MTDRPYTDDDLRAEAARQLSAHGPGTSPEQVYAAMLDARIESTDGRTWSEALDAPELDLPASTIHDLINGAADVSEWAVNLGADGLEPEASFFRVRTSDGLAARIHFAFPPGTPMEARARFLAHVAATASDEITISD